MDVRIGFDEIRRLVWWFLKKESIFLSSPVLVFFTLRFYLGAAFVLRLLHTWLIGGGLWCDIELLKRATAPLLPSFSCTFSATLCALRLILSQPYILCLSSLRRASFSRYFTHHPLGRGVGFFFLFFPLPAAGTQNYLYCTLLLRICTESRIFPTKYPMRSRRYSHLGCFG